jgi:FkbM family methyltransferase
MAVNQDGHLFYTVNEWCKEPFTTMLDIIFSDENVNNFIDIGANVGGIIYSLNYFNYLKKLKKIVCFEPDNDNYNYLINICENIKKTNDIEIKCHKYGIYYGKTESKVYGVGDGNIGGYFIFDDNQKYRNVPIVEHNEKIFNLDAIEKFVDFEIDIVKIDIEGSEINVLENSTIIKNSKYIILEWHYNKESFLNFIEINLSNFDIIFDCSIYDSENINYLLKNKYRI